MIGYDSILQVIHWLRMKQVRKTKTTPFFLLWLLGVGVKEVEATKAKE